MSKSAPSKKRVTTIWLEPGIQETRLFFCFNCKAPIIEYYGNVKTIVPGGSPYTPSTILKCKGSFRQKDGTWVECGQHYSFQQSVFAKDDKK